jgi:hypothetical protein
LKNPVFPFAAWYKDVPPFLMAERHQKWEPFENHVFWMAMLQKPWMAFSTN